MININLIFRFLIINIFQYYCRSHLFTFKFLPVKNLNFFFLYFLKLFRKFFLHKFIKSLINEVAFWLKLIFIILIIFYPTTAAEPNAINYMVYWKKFLYFIRRYRFFILIIIFIFQNFFIMHPILKPILNHHLVRVCQVVLFNTKYFHIAQYL